MDRKRANPNPGLVKNGDSSPEKVFFERREVRQKQECLVPGMPLDSASKENDRWFYFITTGEESTEIGIRGDDDPILGLSPLKDDRVSLFLQSVVTDVGCVVPRLPQDLGHEWGEGVVDQEFHEAERRGISRSRTASAAYIKASRMSPGSRSG